MNYYLVVARMSSTLDKLVIVWNKEWLLQELPIITQEHLDANRSNLVSYTKDHGYDDWSTGVIRLEEADAFKLKLMIQLTGDPYGPHDDDDDFFLKELGEPIWL